MSVRNLNYLFGPESVAIVGASNQPRSVGSVALRNLLDAGFPGAVLPVNPKYTNVCGVPCYPDVNQLPQPVDMAVICTPAETLPRIIESLGSRGTKAAVILTAAMRPQSHSQSDFTSETVAAARRHGVRLLGPNCIGLIVPRLKLNASFAHTQADPGQIAFVSQSGALCTAVLDWARERGIGFSHLVSLGDQADVDFGDVLDFLGGDPYVKGVLLYIEAIQHARKFISAARAAARNKPVLVLKAGRQKEGAIAAATHTGALAGQDEVYDAAIRRAGMLRVFDMQELFDAIENLARAKPLTGETLTVLTNGGGPAVLAVDELIATGGRLAKLSNATIAQLDTMLPANWSRANPIDLIGDADAERYLHATETLLRDDSLGSLLIINVPTAINSGDEVSRGLIPAIQQSRKPVLTCWLGGETARLSRERFTSAGIPTFNTPTEAVTAFSQVVRFRLNQELLMEVPPSIPQSFQPDKSKVRALIEQSISKCDEWLLPQDAMAILQAYDIPVVPSQFANSADMAAETAKEIGLPVALKIVSPHVVHKSDVGGVTLNLGSQVAVRQAAHEMLARIQYLQPDAKVDGFWVQKMTNLARAHELLLGIKTDATFGPVIVFGQGGTAVEVVDDSAVALPPLNLRLAADLVSRTRISKLLHGYRDRPAVDMDALYLTLVKLSQLVVDQPKILELDINPLCASADGLWALDVRIRVGDVPIDSKRLAIQPYPDEIKEQVVLASGELIDLRPIRPEDEPAHQEFFRRLDPEDIYFRFFGLVRHYSHSQMARFTQIDYDREMAIIAQIHNGGGNETLGVVRAISDPDKTNAEFAIIVRSDMKGKGLGTILMDKIIRYCRDVGIRRLIGQMRYNNRPMLDLAKHFGFAISASGEPGIVEGKLELCAAVQSDCPAPT